MGLRFIIGQEAGYDDRLEDKAVLFDSVTDIAFGRIMYADNDRSALEIGQAFLDWCEKERGIKNGDVRALPTEETIALQDEFLSLRQGVIR